MNIVFYHLAAVNLHRKNDMYCNFFFIVIWFQLLTPDKSMKLILQ